MQCFGNPLLYGITPSLFKSVITLYIRLLYHLRNCKSISQNVLNVTYYIRNQSRKLCDCGYKNEKLTLRDREWICPQCGQIHDRDVNAANNILRKGISELVSNSKTDKSFDFRQLRLSQESHVL